MMLMLVVRYVALYCISIVTNPTPGVSTRALASPAGGGGSLISRPSRLAASRGLEVKTITIQQDLLALILPQGMRRDIRTSPSDTSRVLCCVQVVFLRENCSHTKTGTDKRTTNQKSVFKPKPRHLKNSRHQRSIMITMRSGRRESCKRVLVQKWAKISGITSTSCSCPCLLS